MSKLYAKDSGLNSHNDSAREASSARGKNNWFQTMIFGSQSANRKDFLENYKYSITDTQYKRRKAKAYNKKKRKKTKSKGKKKKRKFGKKLFKGKFL